MRAIAGTLVVIGTMALAAAPALASHGGGGSGGGGGGGGTAPPPAGAPAASLSATTLTYAAHDVGTTSAAQTVTLSNTGSAGLFVNGLSQAGVDPLDFAQTDDQCSGITIAPGGSCSLTVVFKPTATGARTATISFLDNAPTSPQMVTFNGTGTSPNGPTPLTVDTFGLACSGGVCDLGGTPFVNNFFLWSFGAQGDTAPPFTWTPAAGALPPGLTLSPDGRLSGIASATGTSTFTLRVTDPSGKTATQAFSLTIVPPPAPGDPQCQHAPSNQSLSLSGPAIGGRAPGGTAIADQSKLTACGGFVVLNTSVRNVNLPDGTVLWVTLSGRPIGTIALSGGAGSIKPYVYANSLRKTAIQIYAAPPPIVNGEATVLAGGSFS